LPLPKPQLKPPMITKPEVISLRMSEDEKKLLVDAANQQNISVAELAHRLVVQGLESYRYSPTEKPNATPNAVFTNRKLENVAVTEHIEKPPMPNHAEAIKVPPEPVNTIKENGETRQQKSGISDSEEHLLASKAQTEQNSKPDSVYMKTEWGIARKQPPEFVGPLQREKPETDTDEEVETAKVNGSIFETFDEGHWQGFVDTEALTRLRFIALVSDLLKELLPYQTMGREQHLREILNRWEESSRKAKSELNQSGIEALQTYLDIAQRQV
jgi:hypothetical protein